MIGFIVYLVISMVVFAIHKLKFADHDDYADILNLTISLFWPIELIGIFFILTGNLIYKGLSKLTRIK